jgi:cytoskeleton protein RodZ
VSIGNSPEEDRPAAGNPEDRPTVGRTLQQARDKAKLTVEDVSTSTRVRAPIVHAIEADDFSRCGGDVYARGHVRTLARAVGLDPGALVEQYDEEHGGRPEPVAAATLFEAERIRPERRRPNWTAAMVAAIVAVVGFVGFTLFSGGDEPGRPVAGDTQTKKPAPDRTPEPTRPADPKPEPSDSAIAGAPADKVTVRMEADEGSSWMSAEDHSGKLLFEGVLEEGESKTFTDDEQLDLVLGNAGAVKLWVNGKEVERLGAVGNVERVTYTRGDPEQG